MKRVLIISLIVLSMFLVGCGTIMDYLMGDFDDSDQKSKFNIFNKDNSNHLNNSNNQDSWGGIVDNNGEEITDSEKKDLDVLTNVDNDEGGCKKNKDCVGDESCIDGECGMLSELYETEGCTEKCNYNSVVVETSDEQTFTLNRGKGSYTAAGAIQWILTSGPDYCPGDDFIVPVKIRKIIGKEFDDQYVTVKVGQKSTVITHPNIDYIKFTFTVKSVNEECG